MTTERAPELHPILQGTLLTGTPTYETCKRRVLHKLAAEANVLVELIEQLKPCTGIRPPDRYGDHYGPDEHLRLAEAGQYREALALITTKGRR
jgi:hypothetical protein